MKMENVLVGVDMSLKIADFGFATKLSETLTKKAGTACYMAPEIHLKQPYEGTSVDVFSTGVILFMLVAAHSPFTTAEKTDNLYKLLACNRADLFWKLVCKNKPSGESFFSEDFKELI